MHTIRSLALSILILQILSTSTSKAFLVKDKIKKLYSDVFVEKSSSLESPIENDELTSEDAIEFDIGEILDKEELYIDEEGFMSFRCKEGLKTQTIEEQIKYPLIINDIKKYFQDQIDPGVYSFFGETGQGHADDTCIEGMTSLLEQFYDEVQEGDLYIDETVGYCLELAVLDFIGKGAEEMCDYIIHDIFYILGQQENLTAEGACDLLYLWGYAYWGANAVDVSLTYAEQEDTEDLLLIQKVQTSLQMTKGLTGQKSQLKKIKKAQKKIKPLEENSNVLLSLKILG